MNSMINTHTHTRTQQRQTDRQTAWHAWDHVVRREEHPLHSGAWSLCSSLWAGLACSPTDCAIGSLWLLLAPTDVLACSPTALHASARSSLCLWPACLLALACLLMLAYGLTVALSLACLKIFPCLWPKRLYGAGNGSQTVSGIIPYTHAREQIVCNGHRNS